MNNTVVRSISGVVFLGIVLCGLLIHKVLFAVLFALMMAGMMAEFYRMTMGDCYKASRALAIFTGVLLFVALFLVRAYGLNANYVALCAIPLLVLMSTSLYAKDREDFPKFANLYTGMVYIALPLSLSNMIVFNRDGEFSGLLMLSFFCIIWASDIGAYCLGLLLGKNGKKLFPSISPKKSWAGFWGGMAVAIIAAVVMKYVRLLDLPLVHSIVLAIVMHVAGVYGDLFESQWKRYYGLKDSGKVIPGHGGLLDRFDSTIFAIPAGVVYLIIVGLL